MAHGLYLIIPSSYSIPYPKYRFRPLILFLLLMPLTPRLILRSLIPAVGGLLKYDGLVGTPAGRPTRVYPAVHSCLVCGVVADRSRTLNDSLSSSASATAARSGRVATRVRRAGGEVEEEMEMRGTGGR